MVELYQRLVNWIRDEEKGQGLVEYALILVLISIVAIVALQAIGTNASTVFQSIANKLNAT